MRRITACVFAALLVFSASAASAKVKSRVITVGQDFRIAGTTVKAGTYRFSFDDQKNELTVNDRKTKEVLARAEARAEAWKKGSGALGLHVNGSAVPLSVEGVAFNHGELVRVSASAAQGQ